MTRESYNIKTGQGKGGRGGQTTAVISINDILV